MIYTGYTKRVFPANRPARRIRLARAQTRQQFYEPIAVAATHGESQSLVCSKLSLPTMGSSQTRHKRVAPVAHDVNTSLEAGGNGGASARELVLERDLVVRALPPFLGLGDLMRLSRTNAGCLREVRQGLRALGETLIEMDNLTDADVSTQEFGPCRACALSS